jgi:trehalose 6-phosphate synthase/phosphatase
MKREKGTMDGYEKTPGRLITVSNHLPVSVKEIAGNRYRVLSNTGDPEMVLSPIFRKRSGMWVGLPGVTSEYEESAVNNLLKSYQNGYELVPVYLTAREIARYYEGFSNQVIWPLFHDFASHCNFDQKFWFEYQKVNQKFARVIKEHIQPNDLLWIHDYHLMLVAHELRKLGIKNKIAFFLHIPFPVPDIYFNLPWRFQLLNGLVDFNSIGFQTLKDRHNFVQCLRSFMDDTRGTGRGNVLNFFINKHEVRVGAFPLGIDYHEFAKLAATEEISRKVKSIKKELKTDYLILGVDRLDYTKGILERLTAYRVALEKYPELIRKVSYIQVVVPSRRQIPEYAELKVKIERMVSEINGHFTRYSWVPVHYIFRNLDRKELTTYYRAADLAMVTPLKDGMNLIAKEYCAATIDNQGVLILSEFAGAASEFHGSAFLTNPFDVQGTAEMIYKVYHLDEFRRRIRMKKLRQQVKKYDIYWWLNSFMSTAFSKNLNNFEVPEEYQPDEKIIMV